ncbi:MAG: hypothetical protein HON32_07390 [Francisellaceae bacterium]|jgi:hypothetical protein|nr:hypothetical protein [Francisellaceae bacterium]
MPNFNIEAAQIFLTDKLSWNIYAPIENSKLVITAKWLVDNYSESLDLTNDSDTAPLINNLQKYGDIENIDIFISKLDELSKMIAPDADDLESWEDMADELLTRPHKSFPVEVTASRRNLPSTGASGGAGGGAGATPHETATDKPLDRMADNLRILANLKAGKSSTGSKLTTIAKESIKAFTDTYKANKRKVGRVTDFVITPLTPNIPRTHPGVDDSIHQHRNIDHDDLELINIAKSTYSMLLKSREAILSPCPLIPQIQLDDDPVLNYLTGNGIALLKTYKSVILSEKQKDIVFHISGHGGPLGIGSVNPEHRVDSDLFAYLMDRLLTTSEIADKFKGDRSHRLKFVFHSCNSAYFNTHAGMTRDEIKEAIAQESFIGRFYNALRSDFSYPNIEVVGFRGFYVPLSNGSGCILQSELSPDSSPISFARGQYSISPDSITLAKVADPIDVKLPDYQLKEFSTFVQELETEKFEEEERRVATLSEKPKPTTSL